MRSCVCKTLPLAIAVLLIGAGFAFAGQNENAVISLTTDQEIAGVGAGAVVEVGIRGAGMVDVKQLQVVLELDPVTAFDLTGSPPFGFTANSTFALTIPAAPDGATISAAAASLGGALNGEADLATFTLTMAGDMTESTQATITVTEVRIGPSATTQDILSPGLAVTLNPPAPAPTISSVAPAEGSMSGGTSITITGANFVDGATVTVGGVAATDVTVVSATSITATAPAGAVGAADVVVANADGQMATSAGAFTYVAIVEPTLTRATPRSSMLSFSAVNTGDLADGSDGEVTMGVSFTGAAGDAGQNVSFAVTNNGAEMVYVVGANATEIAANETATVVVATDAGGAASIALDSEGDRQAGSTSVSVTASVAADNSDGVTRNLSVNFDATWDVPVVAELAAFGASVTPGHEVVLEWSVVSQTANLGWEIYRSTDNIAFERVGDLVAGAGTSDEFLTYSFQDESAPAADVLYYYLNQVDLDGSTSRSSVIEIVVADAMVVPTSMALMQNYPNPFNPGTTITFDVSEESVVTLRVYDLTGQVVRTLVSGEQYGAGRYESSWDGRSDSGARVASGVYFYRLTTDGFTAMKKMTLLQ